MDDRIKITIEVPYQSAQVTEIPISPEPDTFNEDEGGIPLEQFTPNFKKGMKVKIIEEVDETGNEVVREVEEKPNARSKTTEDR